jgi:hypothetical protein
MNYFQCFIVGNALVLKRCILNGFVRGLYFLILPRT